MKKKCGCGEPVITHQDENSITTKRIVCLKHAKQKYNYPKATPHTKEELLELEIKEV